jgi:hypothetical protein
MIAHDCNLVQSSIPLSYRQKAIYELMMYKSFVSHHPFNFLYPVLKNFSFLQQILKETFE